LPAPRPLRKRAPLSVALVRCNAGAARGVHTAPQRAMLRAAYVTPMTACRAATAS
jgi:hypothetical protein